jgi:hypothetical protein
MAAPLSAEVVEGLNSLLYNDELTADDVARWYRQGFLFSASSATKFGLE